MWLEGMMSAGNTKVVGGGGHVLKVAYINSLANLTHYIMMKMLSRNLQNNGDEFCGGLRQDGAGGGCGRKVCELLSKIKGEFVSHQSVVF